MRRPIVRTPQAWVAHFREGIVPRLMGDHAGQNELNLWMLGRAVEGLPHYQSDEGERLIQQAVKRSRWCPLR